MAKKFTNNNWQSDVIEASKNVPVLVDFFADWCGPCQIQGPIIDELAEELENKASIGKLNTESDQEIAMKYGIMSIPTLIVFKDGEAKETITGLKQKEALKEILKKYN